MLTDDRLFRRSDLDFPTTRVMQKRLVAAGRVEGEGPLDPALPLHRTSFDVPVPDVWPRRPTQTGKLPPPEGPSIRLARPTGALAGRSARTRTGRSIRRWCEVCH